MNISLSFCLEHTHSLIPVSSHIKPVANWRQSTTTSSSQTSEKEQEKRSEVSISLVCLGNPFVRKQISQLNSFFAHFKEALFISCLDKG